MTSFRSTVLPQPLSPMTASVCPRATARSRAWSTRWGPNCIDTWRKAMSSEFGVRSSVLGSDIAGHFACRGPITPAGPSKHLGAGGGPDQVVQVVEEQGQEEVDHEDGDEGADEGVGGGPAHALGAGAAGEPAVAADDADGRPEERRLDQAGHEVPQL